MSFRTFYIDNSHTGYQEQWLPESVIEKFYLIENPNRIDIIGIPDGHIDLEFIWENGVCSGFVCGSFLRGRRSLVSGYQRCFGIRLRPEMQLRVLHQRVEMLMDRRVPLREFMDATALERHLEECVDFAEMICAARSFFEREQVLTLPVIASGAARLIAEMTGVQRISEVADAMGYTQKHINRVFRQNYGLSIKQYSGIVRIQTALRSLETADVMDVIAELGYYDQSHFIRDFKQYTSMTPKRFVDNVCNRKQRAVV